MQEAKLFMNGQSQAVRLPKPFRFDGDAVYVKRQGRGVLLLPKDQDPWELMVESLSQFSPELELRRDPGQQQTRPALGRKRHAGGTFTSSIGVRYPWSRRCGP
jgi:antitoxin VapB